MKSSGAKPASGAPAQRSAGPARLAAFVADEAGGGVVSEAAAQLGYGNPIVIVGRSDQTIDQLRFIEPPAVVIADLSGCENPESVIAKINELRSPTTRIIAVGDRNDVGLYRNLLAWGVQDYFLKPVGSAQLVEVVGELPGAPDPGQQQGRVVAVIGSRGGVGASTLALSAGWIIAKRAKVMLLDLDLQFGNLALNLDLEPAHGFAELLRNPARIDHLLVGSATIGSGGLKILAGEEGLEEEIGFSPQSLPTLLGELRGGNDVIIIDAPRHLGLPTRQALSLADTVVVITELTLAGMRDTHRLTSLCGQSNKDLDLVVVANKVGGVAGEMDRRDFEQSIGSKFRFCVPFDAKAALSSAESAKTLIEVCRSPKVAGEIAALAEALGPGPAVESQRPELGKERRPLLSRLMGG